jgi:hypothetical protein
MFNEALLNEITTTFGSEKVNVRIGYFEKYLTAYCKKFPAVQLQENLNNTATLLGLFYFKNCLQYVKEFIDDGNYSNRYKIAATNTFTILSLELLFQQNQASRDVNIKFAKYVAYHTLFGFEGNFFNIFESYLDSNVGVVNDKFDNIQEHHNFYLKNLHLQDDSPLPIMLYALFLQAFTQWIEFRNPDAVSGLQL